MQTSDFFVVKHRFAFRRSVFEFLVSSDNDSGLHPRGDHPRDDPSEAASAHAFSAKGARSPRSTSSALNPWHCHVGPSHLRFHQCLIVCSCFGTQSPVSMAAFALTCDSPSPDLSDADEGAANVRAAAAANPAALKPSSEMDRIKATDEAIKQVGLGGRRPAPQAKDPERKAARRKSPSKEVGGNKGGASSVGMKTPERSVSKRALKENSETKEKAAEKATTGLEGRPADPGADKNKKPGAGEVEAKEETKTFAGRQKPVKNAEAIFKWENFKAHFFKNKTVLKGNVNQSTYWTQMHKFYQASIAETMQDKFEEAASEFQAWIDEQFEGEDGIES